MALDDWTTFQVALISGLGGGLVVSAMNHLAEALGGPRGAFMAEFLVGVVLIAGVASTIPAKRRRRAKGKRTG